MRSEYKTKTNIGVGIGILFQVAGRVLISVDSELAPLAMIFILLGAIFFIWGCMNYAKGKGHSKWMGLLGFLSCLGLLILIALPDHYKNRR